MDTAKCNSAENTGADIPTGMGIFSGKPETTGRIGCLLISVICVILTGIFTFSLLGVAPLVQEDIIIVAFCFLITILSIFFSVFSFTYSSRKREKFIFEGVWFFEDKICLGEHEIELQEKCSINNLINKERPNRLQANWEQTKRSSCIDIAGTSMLIEVMNFKHDYRIEKIHIVREKNGVHYNFVSTPTVLMMNGILYSCNTLTLIDQLRKIAESLKMIQKNDSNCNLTIVTPQIDILENLSIMMGSTGELNDKTKAQHTMSTLQKGKFIDKESSDFLITLINDYGWKVEFYPLKN